MGFHFCQEPRIILTCHCIPISPSGKGHPGRCRKGRILLEHNVPVVCKLRGCRYCLMVHFLPVKQCPHIKFRAVIHIGADNQREVLATYTAVSCLPVITGSLHACIEPVEDTLGQIPEQFPYHPHLWRICRIAEYLLAPLLVILGCHNESLLFRSPAEFQRDCRRPAV